jgi:hypothetical protein
MTHRHYMIAALAALAVMASVFDGNSFIRKNLAAYLDRVPVPPRTALDAFGKSASSGGALKVNPDMEKLEKEFQQLNKDYAVSQKNSQSVKNLEEVKGKYTEEQIKNMSMEQKMALARQMQEKMGMGVNNESPAVMPAIISLTKTGAEMANFFGANNISIRISKINDKYQQLHDKISGQLSAAQETCPVLSSGESSAPDQACLKAKSLEYIDKHIKLETSCLEEIQAAWSDYRGTCMQFIVRIDTDMASTRYGDLITSPMTRQQIETTQMMGFSKIEELYQITKEAQLSAATWIADKKEYRKQ